MVDKALISQLQSPERTERKEAIMALGRTKDRTAIPHLTRVVETDTDEELRDLARKAAIYIDKNAPFVNVKPFTLPWDDEEPEEEAVAGTPTSSSAAALLDNQDIPGELGAVDQQDRDWAERYIERAWQAHYTSDRETAEMYMRKALERSPAIAETEAAREAASKILNTTPERAISALLNPKTAARRAPGDTAAARKSTGIIRTSTTGTMPKASTGVRALTGTQAIGKTSEEKTADEIEDGSLVTLIVDLLIFFVVVSVLEFIAILVANPVVLEALTSPRAPNDPFSAFLRNLLIDISVSSPVSMAVYSMFSAVQWLIILLVISFLTHIVASSLFEGNSTFPRLIRKTYLAYALVFSAGSTIFAVALYISFTPNNPSTWQTLFAVSTLVGAFLVAWRIGAAYRFDFARGCFTIVLTLVGLICCSATIALAMIAANVGPFTGVAEQLSRR